MMGSSESDDRRAAFGAGLASSSSSLRVRSTTLWGRLLGTIGAEGAEGLEADGTDDSSLEDRGGVRTLCGVRVSSLG
jgi:hypothetical protein